MPLGVQRKMIAPAETPVTVVTLEGFLTGVLASVAREFVATCKFPRASFPFADVRLLARVCPSVRLWEEEFVEKRARL